MTTVRNATAADFYGFARIELARARLCVVMLRAVAESADGWENPFGAEATRDGLDLLLDCLVKADGWRAHARRARRS
jgi:hypothetical protein